MPRKQISRLASRYIRAQLLIAAALVASLVAAPGDGSINAAQSPAPHPQQRSGIPKAPPKPKAPRELAVPFRVGEKLSYRVAWATFSNAASVELAAPEKRELFGWQTWHFQAVVHTVSPVRSLFTIDDQFDSYSDSTSLESRQYESYLNELGKTEKDVLHLIPSGEHPRSPGAAVIVLPGTRDALGMLYALRAADWQRSPALVAPVYDGANLYELHATLENAADTAKVDAGSFTAQRIAIKLFENGKENPAIHFTLWLATDASRTPVLIAAQLPFGTLRVELTSANLERADLR
jgi:hypothetical protein